MNGENLLLFSPITPIFHSDIVPNHLCFSLHSGETNKLIVAPVSRCNYIEIMSLVALIWCPTTKNLFSNSQACEEGRTQVLWRAVEVQPGASDALPLPPVWHHGQGSAGHPLLLLHQHHGGTDKSTIWITFTVIAFSFLFFLFFFFFCSF